MSAPPPPMTRRQKWDKKHVQATEEPPSAWLETAVDTLPRGRCLDIACGLGRHTALMARHGYAVDAIDWSFVALRRLKRRLSRSELAANLIAADLLHLPLPRNLYDVVLCFRYLERGLWRSMADALRPGGVVVLETRTTTYLELNPAFPKEYCLLPGELLRGFSELSITHYHESTETGLASLIAHRPVAN